MKDFLKMVVFGALFAVPFLTLYVENDFFFPFITGKNFWFRIIVDVAFAAWVILALYEPKYRPKWSWLVSGFGALLVIMFFANLFGVHPSSSFWSNFERMDGYVSLVHTFMYFVILGSMMHSKQLWVRLLKVSLVVAFAVASYGLLQYTGVLPGSNRIDSRLGNAAYMAIYTLFHIFFAFWLLVETKKSYMKIIYALLALMFTFVLIETGTRGTAVGLAVGVFVMSGYIAIFGKQFKDFRKYAIGAFVLMLIGVSAFALGRETDFVQNNNNLSRIANISLDDLEIRSIIWQAGIQGAAERPLLGYGQSNFNFVFNEYYDPRLYAQEQWFDRGHNIFVDWLVTGGAFGLVAYLSIFVAFIWYLFIRPIIKEDDSFTVLERGVLLGILAGYFTHNLVVFDNIVSYIFFAIILGLVHSRVSTPIKSIQYAKVDESIITQFAAPVMVVVLGVGMYFAHVPGMQVAGEIIDAFQEPDPLERLEIFKTALERDTFARQEIVEQLSQQTIGMMRNPNVSPQVKELYARTTEEELRNLTAWKPGDARIEVFVGTYYRSIGQFDQAAEYMHRARELSPMKQSIMLQQAFVELSRNMPESAIGFFESAFKVDERNQEARSYYAAGLIQVDRQEEAAALMDSDAARDRFARNDFLVQTASEAEMNDFLLEIFKERVRINPGSSQNWATLAYLHYQLEDNDSALEVLRDGSEVLPEFAPVAACISDNIKNDRAPEEGC